MQFTNQSLNAIPWKVSQCENNSTVSFIFLYHLFAVASAWYRLNNELARYNYQNKSSQSQISCNIKKTN